MPIRLTVLFAIIFGCMPAASFAATQTIKGMATISISSSDGPSPSEMAMAMKEAKINAVERYVANTNSAEQRNYDLIKQKVAANIDNYVLSSSIVSQQTDKQAKTYTLVVSSEINVSELENALQANSAVSNTSQSSRSYITFIFVARHQNTVQSFDNEVTKHNNSTTAENGMDMNASTGTKKGYASTTNKYNTVTTGGSVIQRANKVTYTVTSSDAVNDVISNQLSEAGYQVVDAAFVQQMTNGKLNIDSFKSDFVHGNDISPSTLINAALGVQEAKVPYLAYGTLDVGFTDTDPTTGLKRVYVTVTSKVYDLTGRFPVTVASVGPVQYAGLGPSEDVARTNALQLAAKTAADSLVSEMNAKGIH